MVNTNLPALLENEKVKARFLEVLDKNAPNFISNLLAVWNSNEKLKNCDANSIIAAAGTAANLNLSISPSLGQAYIVPFSNKATFQLGIRGLIQLAHRTGLYKTLNSNIVREGEIRGVDVITGEIVRGEKISDKTVGYVAYMELLNGFRKSLYMTVEEIQKHAQKYSQSYAYDLKSGKKSSVWSTNFDAMAKKTVMKLLLNNWGLITLNSALAEALKADSSLVTKDEFCYLDNGGEKVKRDPITVETDNSKRDDFSEFAPENVDAETGEILTVESE